MFACKTRLSSRVALLFVLSGLAIAASATDQPFNLKQPLNNPAIDSVPEEPMGTLTLPQALAIALL